MNSGGKELVIFIILVCIAVFIWHNKPKEENVPQKTITEQENHPVQKQKSYKKNFLLNYTTSLDIFGNGTDKLFLSIPIPTTLPFKQTVTNSKFLTSPTKILTREESQYAVFELTSPQSVHLQYDFSAKIQTKRYDYQTAQKNTPGKYILENKTRYLKSEQYIDVDNTTVMTVANSLSGASTIEILQSISDYMTKNLNQLHNSTGDIGSAKVLQYKNVSIGDYANTFTALCRAKKIPARVVSGYKISEKSGLSTHHAWVEVFFTQYGWVTFDPYSRKGQSIAETDDMYLVLAHNSYKNYELKYTFKKNSTAHCNANVNLKFTPEN